MQDQASAVRRTRRSRGCERCKERKIKCDENTPQCRNCIRIGRPCPGVYGGLIVIQSIATPNCLQSTRPLPLASLSVMTPSNAPVYEQFLISWFIDFFSKPGVGAEAGDSWMRYLPYYTSSSKALTAGIRAATMIAFGRMSKNIDMQREAMWWYTYTLRLQSIGVSQYMQPPPAKSTIPTPDDLCISMMLMYYELIYPTSPGSWVRHLYGAARLLELRGAENCQSGFPHVLFRALRLLVAFCCIITRHYSQFAFTAWCTLPFARIPKQAPDKLLDIVFSVGVSLLSDGAIGTETGSSVGPRPRQQDLIRELEHITWRQGHGELPGPQLFHNDPQYPLGPLRPAIAYRRVQSLGGDDFCTTLPFVMYHAVWVVLLHVCHDGDPSFSGSQIEHCASILGFVDAISHEALSSHMYAGARVQLGFPLKIIAMFSPSPVQRSVAEALLKQMGWYDIVGETHAGSSEPMSSD